MTSVNASGPIFDGSAERALGDFLEDASKNLGEYVQGEVQNRLKTVLRHPTGFYQSHIDIKVIDTHAVVSDSGVIYGPWLEGVSSRNKRSRFKGYHTFRLVNQQIQAKSVDVAERDLHRYLDRMG